MKIATSANVRTTLACSSPVNPLQAGLTVAFKSGAVMSFSVVATGLLGVSLSYLVLEVYTDDVFTHLSGFAFGASAIGLFARVGGGIYTKAADVGADLVGKVEESLEEDDPNNPATVADNVGDNVGDVAGMGADLFESFVGSLIAAITLGLFLSHTLSHPLLSPLSFLHFSRQNTLTQLSLSLSVSLYALSLRCETTLIRPWYNPHRIVDVRDGWSGAAVLGRRPRLMVIHYRLRGRVKRRRSPRYEYVF